MKKFSYFLALTCFLFFQLLSFSSMIAQPGIFIDSGQDLGSSNTWAVALGDLDGDGDLDAFVANFRSANKVWINDGTALFSESGQTIATYFSADVSLGDVDNDGDLDAFVSSYGGGNEIWLNDGNGTFTNSGQSLGDVTTKNGVLLDLDGDGDLDIYEGVSNNPDKVWFNDGNGIFTDSGQSLGDSYGSSEDVSTGDVDGDGDIDIYKINSSYYPRLWLNDGSGYFTLSSQDNGHQSDHSGAAMGDLDDDGDLDIYIVFKGVYSNTVWFNDGAGIFLESGQTLGNSPSQKIELGDLDGDEDLDAFVVNWMDQPNKTWINDGGGVFTDNGQNLGNSHSENLALGDLDNDGDLDAFVANGDHQPNKVWLNTTNDEITTVELRDSEENLLDGGMLKFYDGGWQIATEISTGIFQFNTELNNISLKMHYAGGAQQINDVSTSTIYTFHTELVTIELKDSGEAGLPDGDVKYYASGWKDFGTTDASGQCTKELLPVSYSFKMYYLGASQQISNHNVSVDPTITFQTALVTAELLDSGGSGLEDGMVKYYASGWKDFGTTDASGQCTKELLPVSYSFKMYYLGASQQISNHNTATNPTVTWNTAEVVVELRKEDETLGLDGGIATYYASGWKDFGVTGDDGLGIVKKELLPVTYHFKMLYDGNTDQISNHNIETNLVVTFNESSFKSTIARLNESKAVILKVYPNPFKTSTTVSFTIRESKNTTLKVYNSKGIEVATLFEGMAQADHGYIFDFIGTAHRNGIYIVHLQSGKDVTRIKKVLLNK